MLVLPGLAGLKDLLALLVCGSKVGPVDPVEELLADDALAPAVLGSIEELGEVEDLGDGFPCLDVLLGEVRRRELLAQGVDVERSDARVEVDSRGRGETRQNRGSRRSADEMLNLIR
jgi:hypothetical protein